MHNGQKRMRILKGWAAALIVTGGAAAAEGGK
jgi:hypothetical protein